MTSYRKKFSVVIPTWCEVSDYKDFKKEDPLIKKTLEAFRKQEGINPKDLEIIIVDNCSGDGIDEIAKPYNANVITERTTIAEARNLGAKNATGEYVIHFNADVIPGKNWIRRAYDRFEIDSPAMLIGSFMSYEEGLRARLFSTLCMNMVRTCIRFGRGQTMGECGIMLKKVIWEMLGGCRPIKSYEEVDLGLRTAKLSKMNKLGGVVLEERCKSRASLRRLENDGYVKWGLLWFYSGLKYELTGEALKSYPKVRNYHRKGFKI